MKFAVAKEHRDFFHKHFRIEFNGLLSDVQCNQLMAERLEILAERLHVSKANFKSTAISEQFMAGFDLWRGNAHVKKIICQKSLAEIATELLEVRALRLGFDQFMPAVPAMSSTPDDIYHAWLAQATTLQEMSSIQGLMAGLIICIKAPQVVTPETETGEVVADVVNLPNTEAPSLFSTKLGNGVYFSPDVPLDFSSLTQRQGYAYVLIAYTKPISVYYKRDSDPHTNAFRKLGYNFGDRLSDRYHPLIVF